MFHSANQKQLAAYGSLQLAQLYQLTARPLWRAHSSSYAETHTVNFIETNVDTLKVIYGASNVTETNGVITVHSTGKALEEHVVVIELVLTGGRIKRVVIPRAKIADRGGDITYDDTTAIAYPAVFSASPNSNGDYHIEYIAAVQASA